MSALKNLPPAPGSGLLEAASDEVVARASGPLAAAGSLLTPMASLPAGVTVLMATSGADRLVGVGQTAVSYANAPAGLRLYLSGGGDPTGWALGDTYENVVHAIGTAYDDYISGNGRNNHLFGGEGKDSLYGFAQPGSTTYLFGENGDDTLLGGAGTDVMDGGAGENTLSYYISPVGLTISLADPKKNTGWAAGDVYSLLQDVIGSNFNDVIYGSANGDWNQLQGQDGNDVIWGGTGYNTLIGGTGADEHHGGGIGNIIDYEIGKAGVVASMKDPSMNTGDAAGDTYYNLYGADLAGTPFDDVLYGDDGSNHIIADPDYASYIHTGSDRLFGNGGDDYLDGGPNDDMLDGGSGYDYASYGIATAGVTASLANPQINAGEAQGDSYVSIEGLMGSRFNDVLSGDANGNTLFGKGGDDVLNSGGATGALDLLDGGEGADTLNGGSGFDYASYGSASAGVIASLANPSQNTGDASGDRYRDIEGLIGTSFNDRLTGDAGGNALQGGGGDDILDSGGAPAGAIELLDGGAGADTLNGGSGFDYASYGSASAGVAVSLAEPSQNTGDAAGDRYSSVEGLVGSAYADVLTGDLGGNTLQGGGGDDVLNSGGAPAGAIELLDGGAGADTLNGGSGFDYASYGSSAAGVAASLADPSRNTGDAAGDRYSGLEGLVGSAFDDVLTGDGGANTLQGGGGDDVLNSAGAPVGTPELLDGGAGADRLNGGSGFDYASYGSAARGVAASLADPSRNTGDAAGDRYSSIEGLVGSAFDDVLTGDAGANTLQGGGGDDILSSGGVFGAEDLLDGGAGADTLNGGSGYDYATYGSATAGVLASLVEPSTNTGDAAGDRYNGIEGLVGSAFNDRLYGDVSSNVLQGGGGDDVLVGGGGDDLLSGGEGDDVLILGSVGVSMMTGGKGTDTFKFLAVGDSYSTLQHAPTEISDFQSGMDKIDVSAFATSIAIIEENGFYTLQATRGGSVFSVRSHTIFSLADVITTAAQARTMNGTETGDELIAGLEGARLSGFGGNDTVRGGVGADVLVGGAGADVLTGGGGADTFVYRVGDSVAGSADVILDFETGSDRIDLAETRPVTTALVRNGGSTALFSQGSTGQQTQIDVRGQLQGADLLLAGGGVDFVGQDGVADLLIGSDGDDHLFGLSANDRLEGGAGDDQLFGDTGADLLYGGSGGDKFAYRGFADSNAVDGYDIIGDFTTGSDKIDFYYLNGLKSVALSRLNGGTILFASTSGGQVQVGLTSIVQGADLINPAGMATNFGYDLVGESVNETLLGGGGNDKIFGLDGDDVIRGNGGDDQLFGDKGADVLFGGEGADKFAYRGFSDSNAVTGYDIVGDFVSGTDKIDLYYLNGLQSIAVVRSNGSSFVFAATTGGQVQIGSTSVIQGADVVNPASAPANFGYDILGEGGQETLIGSGGDDRMFGLGGNDTLIGGSGDDQIAGDGGIDILTGGAGLDVFLYRQASDSTPSAQDRITDFQVGSDKIDFRNVRGGPNLHLDKYTFTIQGSDTVVSLDLGGDGAVDVSVLLTGVTSLQPADILF